MLGSGTRSGPFRNAAETDDMAYVSEATLFLRELIDKSPELRELRSRNRATWWDHPQEPDVQQEREAARVAQGAYVYFPVPKPPEAPEP